MVRIISTKGLPSWMMLDPDMHGFANDESMPRSKKEERQERQRRVRELRKLYSRRLKRQERRER